MGLNRLLHDMSSELQEVLWDDTPTPDFSAAIERLEHLLDEASTALEEARHAVEGLRQGLAAREKQAAWLCERVEVYLHVSDQANAWRHALDLDVIRAGLDSERDRLRQKQHVYQERLARVRRLRGQLADLQDAV
jgi:hypothetical protein